MPEKKKKVLFVITKSNFGGAQRYVYDLATNLPKDTYEVAVAFGGNGLLKAKLADAGIQTHEIKSFQRDINVYKEVRAMFELASLIRELDPDIVHLNSSKAGGSGAFIARLLGVPRIVFTAHGWAYLEDRSVAWKAIVWLLSFFTGLFSHHVIVVSENDLQKAPTRFVRKKCVRVYPAVPAISFKERTTARNILFDRNDLTLHSKDLFVVSTGEHTKNKNLYVLLKATKAHNKTQSQKIFLTLMHDGEERSGLEKYAKEEAIDHWVHFTGYLDDARSYLTAFDAFVLPSLKEGFPYSILEAGAAGLPVIASRVGGIPEIITDKETGLLIDPQDVTTLTNALKTITTNEKDDIFYTQRLKEKILKDHSLARMIKETQQVYEQ